MIRDKIIETLSQSVGTENSKAIAKACLETETAEHIAAIELLCEFSPEITRLDGQWQVQENKNKASRVLFELNNYTESTGKKIFRLSAALDGIPIHEHPTEEEVQKAIELSNGKFSLLPNSMVKRNS